MKVQISPYLLFMMIHVSLAGPSFKSQKQNREYSRCSHMSDGRECGNLNAQTEIRRSDSKSHSRDTELSSAGNEGLGRGRSVQVGAKVTSSIAGQSARSSSGRQRRSASISSSAPSPSQASSRHERLPSHHEEELIEEDEVLVAKLRSILDEMSASEFLELANEISEEDSIDDEDEEVSSDVTDSAQENANLRSRTKRSIGLLLKKHLLKKHLLKPLLLKPLLLKPLLLKPLLLKKHLMNPLLLKKHLLKPKHKALKPTGSGGHAVGLGILGAGAAGLGGSAGVGYSSGNNN